MRLLLSIAAFVAAWVLLALDVPPVPTWFYVFAWYPTLLLLDALATRLDGRPSLFARPALALSLFMWSPAVWFVFEAFNFRLDNWYYVGLPAAQWERWLGITLSFATVLPAIVLAERVLDAAGLFRSRRSRPVVVRAVDLRASVAIGLAGIALVLLWPRVFFPLVWGVGFVLAEPLAYYRAPAASLVRDLERGERGRLGRVLVGGVGIGFLWESYNAVAGAGWIYTVPGLEGLKLFEMPPLGYVGFPVFALAAWAVYAGLTALGIAVPVSGEPRRLSPQRVWVATVVAGIFALATLTGMERFTISSTAAPGDHAESRGGLASLARLRGMGIEHARALRDLGIQGPCDLAPRDPARVSAQLRAATNRHRPSRAEARVWIRAAQRVCEAGE